jgi:hypothetical protein
MVLLFAKTVLSVEWWKKYIIFTNSENGRRRQEQKEQKQKLEDANRTFTLNHHHITQSKSQSLVQVKKLSKWNNLINKKVFTCEMVDIGHIRTVDNEFMTIIRNEGREQEYVIPTYYVREHDNEKVLIDTSVRYLDRYQINKTI